MRIALVDDDSEILDTLSTYLRRRGCDVTALSSGAELDAALMTSAFDVVVLDLMMPGEDGLSICRRLSGKQPIIMLSAIGDVSDRILGLEMGASDYVTKPFDPRELLARIRSLTRRTERMNESRKHRAFTFEGWVIDLDDRTLGSPTSGSITLSANEFNLLQAFIERPGRLVTRELLLSVTHGDDSEVFDRVIDVTISRLRRKLQADSQASLIETIRGEGHRFRPAVRPVC